jgi:hypothetical protein
MCLFQPLYSIRNLKRLTTTMNCENVDEHFSESSSVSTLKNHTNNPRTKISPLLQSQWHPTKNGNLSPEDVKPCSGKILWWICSKNNCMESCTNPHEWPAAVNNRKKGTGCPWCTQRTDKVCPCQSLKHRKPDLANEWHASKNGSLTPEDVSTGSHKKAWWRCGVCYHVYDALIKSRASNGSGCPKCRVNKAEMRLEDILKAHKVVSSYGKPAISCYDKINKKMRNLRPDCIGETTNGNKFLIELDGRQHFEKVYWYDPEGSDLRDQICSDLAKNKYANENGMSLLRIAYTEYDDLESWVNKFLEKCSKTRDQVFIPSNPTLYNNQRLIEL